MLCHVQNKGQTELQVQHGSSDLVMVTWVPYAIAMHCTALLPLSVYLASTVRLGRSSRTSLPAAARYSEFEVHGGRPAGRMLMKKFASSTTLALPVVLVVIVTLFVALPYMAYYWPQPHITRTRLLL